jgi:hypothetical protein
MQKKREFSESFHHLIYDRLCISTMIVQRNPILIMTNIEWSAPLIRIEPHLDDRRNTSCVFGWSDFPCQGEDLTIQQDISQCHDQTTAEPSLLSDYIPRTQKPLSKLPIVHPPSPTTCCCTLEEEEEEDEEEEILPPNEDADGVVHLPTAVPLPTERRVRFAPLARVRTHTVVLGHHPCCAGGMALQLGWESVGTRYVPLRSSPPQSRNLNDFRLSYAQRRDRLQQLTGLTGSQLLQQEYMLVCCSGYSTVQRDTCIYNDV